MLNVKMLMCPGFLALCLLGVCWASDPQAPTGSPRNTRVYEGPCLYNVDCPDGYVCRYPGFNSNSSNVISKKCFYCPCENGNCSDSQLEPLASLSPCACNDGWVGVYCQFDIDECLFNMSQCGNGSYCVNTYGSYTCECCDGFRKVGDVCIQIDECLEGTHDCDPNADCIDAEPTCPTSSCGSKYNCTCQEGYTGNGIRCRPAVLTGEPAGIAGDGGSRGESMHAYEVPYSRCCMFFQGCGCLYPQTLEQYSCVGTIQLQ